MLPYLQYSLFIAFLSCASSSTSSSLTETSVNDTTDAPACDSVRNIINLYGNPNASNAYPIPISQSLDATGNATTPPTGLSTNEIWHLINALGQNQNPYSHDLELQRLLLLDTSSHDSVTKPVPQALDACSFVFQVPKRYNNKAPTDGECAGFLDTFCINDIQNRARNQAFKIAGNHRISIGEACHSIAANLTTALAPSCPKGSGGTDPDFSLSVSQGLNLTSPYPDNNCTEAPPQSLVPIYNTNEPYQQNNFTAYDEWATKTTPVLLLFFTNATLYTGEPLANTKWLCTSPKNVSAGSRVPSIGAGDVLTVNRSILAGVAIAVSGVLFGML